MIYLENVTKIYENTNIEALSQVNLQVGRGEFLFITGDSGSGKSTLIKLLFGELAPTAGKIVVNGKDISRMRKKDIPEYRRNLGIIFQDMKLLSDRTVFENIAFVREILYGRKKDINQRVTSLLSFMGLAKLYQRYPEQLSGGEKEKVMLARAVVNDPLILLADEPTGNLDPKASAEVMDLFDRIYKRGITVVVATHDIAQVKRLNHRRIELSEGRIIT